MAACLCTQAHSAILESEVGLPGQAPYKGGLVIHPIQATVPCSLRSWGHEDLLLASSGCGAGPWSFLAGPEFTSNGWHSLKHGSVDPTIAPSIEGLIAPIL